MFGGGWWMVVAFRSSLFFSFYFFSLPPYRTVYCHPFFSGERFCHGPPPWRPVPYRPAAAHRQNCEIAQLHLRSTLPFRAIQGPRSQICPKSCCLLFTGDSSLGIRHFGKQEEIGPNIRCGDRPGVLAGRGTTTLVVRRDHAVTLLPKRRRRINLTTSRGPSRCTLSACRHACSEVRGSASEEASDISYIPCEDLDRTLNENAH